MSDAERVDILFVCQHGAAKSVVAAALLPQLAARRGLVMTAGAAGVEPDAAIPLPVVAGLAENGIDVEGNVPRAVTSSLVANAGRVIGFGCDLSAVDMPASLRQWHDLPAVSDGFEAAQAAIIARLELLLDELALETRGD